MKSKLIQGFLLLSAMILFISCEHPMVLETEVHEDGSLTRTITFEKEDSTVALKNIFGIDSINGWVVTSTQLPVEKTKETGSSKVQYRVQFRKNFGSVDDMNHELNPEADTLFRVRATFEKKFRWFYTYIKYSETILPVNRFKKIDPSDYLNQEDFQFIDRLPAEGKSISKADSLYLQLLNVKIGETYANMAIFNEEFDILTELVGRQHLDQWQDTILRKKEYIYNHVDKMKGEGDFALQMADSLKIPLKRAQAIADLKELSKGLNDRVSFMGFANDGKFINSITMPWDVMDTNADSVSGNKLVWRPLVTKFLFREYEMYAESRRMNAWALIVSAAVVLLTLFVWRRNA